MLKSKGNMAFQNTFHLKQPYNNIIITIIIIIIIIIFDLHYTFGFGKKRYLQSKMNKVDGGKIANCQENTQLCFCLWLGCSVFFTKV